MQAYPRDLIGYAGKPPAANWPNQAKLAVQFVLNFEEGAENCVLHGDAHSETFLSDIANAEPYSARHLSMESLYEYGSRAGFWRVHQLFIQHKLPLTVFAVTMAMQRNPDIVEAMLNAEWEIACHGMRWIHYQHMEKQQEQKLMDAAIQLHHAITGSTPSGWYTGRTSPHTLELVARCKELLYCADSYADDLPYYDCNYERPLLMVPYTLDVNDMRFHAAPGFADAEQFFTYLKDTFDVLYNEGQQSPKMMSVGLHCRIIGHPGRFAALQKFVAYILSKQDVWICRRADIARHWLRHHPHSKDTAL